MRPVSPEYKNLSWVWGADQRSPFGIMRLCLEMPNSGPGGRIFLFAPNNSDRFIFLHTFWSPAFDSNVEVAINKSLSYYLTSAILKSDLVCDVTMTSTPNVLTTELHESRQANLCLRAFRHDKFQLRMPSHSAGPGIWLSVWDSWDSMRDKGDNYCISVKMEVNNSFTLKNKINFNLSIKLFII